MAESSGDAASSAGGAAGGESATESEKVVESTEDTFGWDSFGRGGITLA